MPFTQRLRAPWSSPRTLGLLALGALPLDLFGDEIGIYTTAGRGIADLAQGDLDGDGDLDLISASTGDNLVAWYPNLDGAGTFSPDSYQGVSTLMAAPGAVDAGDLDGDGDVDVITGGADRLAWIENTDGLPTWASPSTIRTSPGVRSIELWDLDVDGDLDAVSAEADGVWVYFNGPTSFDGGTKVIEISPTMPGSTAATAADLNGDGLLDIAAVFESFLNTGTVLADGAGGYQATVSYWSYSLFPPPPGTSIAPLDADLDGDLDLMTGHPASFSPSTLAYLNDGSASQFFAEPTSTGLVILDLEAADLNLDGGKEVVYGGAGVLGWIECYPAHPIDILSVVNEIVPFSLFGGPSFDAVLAADLSGDGAPSLAHATDGDVLGYRPNQQVTPYVPPAAISRLGSPPNPEVISSITDPKLAETWIVGTETGALSIDPAFAIFGISIESSNIPSGTGTILCGLNPVLLIPKTVSSSFELHTLGPVPDEASQVGTPLCLQAGLVALDGTIQLTNALDVTIGAY